jgi:predicted RNase H-like HicB family nuclease
MGNSINEVITMIKEIIELHIEDLTVHGEVVPPEDTQTVSVVQWLVLDI